MATVDPDANRSTTCCRIVESADLPLKGAPIVADITFLVDFTVSMTAVILPIVLIVRLLAADDDFTVGELFILPITPNGQPLPPEEETPPRWRPELIGARHRASEPVAPAVSSQQVFRPIDGSEAEHARPG